MSAESPVAADAVVPAVAEAPAVSSASGRKRTRSETPEDETSYGRKLRRPIAETPVAPDAEQPAVAEAPVAAEAEAEAESPAEPPVTLVSLFESKPTTPEHDDILQLFDRQTHEILLGSGRGGDASEALLGLTHRAIDDSKHTVVTDEGDISATAEMVRPFEDWARTGAASGEPHAESWAIAAGYAFGSISMRILRAYVELLVKDRARDEDADRLVSYLALSGMHLLRRLHAVYHRADDPVKEMMTTSVFEGMRRGSELGFFEPRIRLAESEWSDASMHALGADRMAFGARDVAEPTRRSRTLFLMSIQIRTYASLDRSVTSMSRTWSDPLHSHGCLVETCRVANDWIARLRPGADRSEIVSHGLRTIVYELASQYDRAAQRQRPQDGCVQSVRGTMLLIYTASGGWARPLKAWIRSAVRNFDRAHPDPPVHGTSPMQADGAAATDDLTEALAGLTIAGGARWISRTNLGANLLITACMTIGAVCALAGE